MTTKRAIISTLGVVVTAIVLGLTVLFLTIDPSARNANERAALLGQGLAMLLLIPIGFIWIMWVMRVRSERGRL